MAHRVRRDQRPRRSSATRCYKLGVGDDLGADPRRVRRDSSRTSPSTCSWTSTASPSTTSTWSSYLELLRKPYTGCNPRGLMLARDKALSKKILAYHRIRVAALRGVSGRQARARGRQAHLSAGRQIAERGGLARHLAGLARDQRREAHGARRVHARDVRRRRDRRGVHRGPRALRRRVGNQRLHTFPIWELSFADMPEERPASRPQGEVGPRVPEEAQDQTHRAEDLPEDVEEEIQRMCTRMYRVLGLSGYARVDLRLAPDGKVYVLEANPTRPRSARKTSRSAPRPRASSTPKPCSASSRSE